MQVYKAIMEGQGILAQSLDQRFLDQKAGGRSWDQVCYDNSWKALQDFDTKNKIIFSLIMDS
jgi:hypothetical protein